MKRDDEISKAFMRASIALSELENEIKECYNTPVENIGEGDYDKIKIPRSYIRSKGYFIKKYNLSSLIGKNRNLYNNIAYSLQLSDLYNFFINRFHLFGAIKNQFLKNCITHNYCIAEGIIHEVIYDLGEFCMINNKTCQFSQECSCFINRSKSLSNTKAFEILKDRIKTADYFYKNLSELNEIRNRVHVRIIEVNEYFNTDNALSLANYNKSIKTLNYIKNAFLNDISNFLSTRENVCMKTLD